jgi:crossover junction endodeoxyribonuclease RuvC
MTNNERGVVMLYIGIDTGVTGAVAAVNREGTYIGVQDLPIVQHGTAKFIDAFALLNILNEWQATARDTAHGLCPPCRVYIESATAMGGAKMGVSAIAQVGRSLGCAVATVTIFGQPFEMVAPVVWKRRMSILAPKGSTDKQKKEIALSKARGMFPGAELELQKHHNRAEALLLADYGRLWNQGRIA